MIMHAFCKTQYQQVTLEANGTCWRQYAVNLPGKPGSIIATFLKHRTSRCEEALHTVRTREAEDLFHLTRISRLKQLDCNGIFLSCLKGIPREAAQGSCGNSAVFSQRIFSALSLSAWCFQIQRSTRREQFSPCVNAQGCEVCTCLLLFVCHCPDNYLKIANYVDEAWSLLADHIIQSSINKQRNMTIRR